MKVGAARDRLRKTLVAWTAIGAFAFALLPWYLAADKSLLESIRDQFGAADSANGLRAAAMLGKPWLASALVALALCAAACFSRGPRRARLATTGAAIGLVGILASGFSIGASGWSFAWLNTVLGALPAGQAGFGLGGALTLLSFVMLLGCGLAGLGRFGGDVFIAAAVMLCSTLMLLFVALPVAVALSGAVVDDAGRVSLSALAERVGNEHTWGLACLAGGVRCGVAWNTLFLATLTAFGTTLLGTLIALVAERGDRRLKRPVNLLSLLPIITPPFVVGLGLILLFGRAGIVNALLESLFGITPTRWFYGLPGLWLAQLFAFTPIACLIMRGVVSGVSPSLEEAAQTLRADRWTTFRTITLPLLKPGLANAFLVGFIESLADFGNPIVVGGQYNVLSTDVFFALVGAQFDQGRAASLALLLSAFALGVFALQQKVVGKAGYTTVSGKGDSGVPMRLARPACLARCSRWSGRGLRSRSSSTCSRSPAASSHSGAATTRRRCATSSPPSTCNGATPTSAAASSGPARRGARSSRR